MQEARWNVYCMCYGIPISRGKRLVSRYHTLARANNRESIKVTLCQLSLFVMRLWANNAADLPRTRFNLTGTLSSTYFGITYFGTLHFNGRFQLQTKF